MTPEDKSYGSAIRGMNGRGQDTTDGIAANLRVAGIAANLARGVVDGDLAHISLELGEGGGAGGRGM